MKNTVCKQVLGRYKGHVYSRCYDVPNYCKIVYSCDRIWLRFFHLSLLLLLAAPQAPAREIQPQAAVCCIASSLNIRGL